MLACQLEFAALPRDLLEQTRVLQRNHRLVREGLRLFKELPRSATSEVLLATDLHAGNVLQA